MSAATAYPRRLPPPLPSRKSSTHNEWDPPPAADLGIGSQASKAARALATRRVPPPLPVRGNKAPSGPSDPDLPNTPPPPINYATRPVFNRKPVLPQRKIVQEPVVLPPPTGPSCIQCRDFSGPDTHASQFPREHVRSLQELARQLTDPFPDEVDKARAIFTWLHYNIAYDAASFLSGNVKAMSTEETLARGLAVCDGYGGLFEQLADHCGIVAHKVTGHGKGYGYAALQPGDPLPEMNSNHAWNCVQMDGEWHLIDSCWGAGSLDASGVYKAELAERWFISPPTLFAERHFPSDPSFQLTPERLMWEDYISAPEPPNLPASFFHYKLDPVTLQPSVKNLEGGQYTTFTVAKRCEHLSTADRDNWVFVIHAEGEFTPLRLDPRQNHWTASAYVPVSGQIILCVVETIGGRDAKGLGYQAYMQAKGKKAMTFKSLVAWDVV